jgi:IclR family transcriptional regulator, acetate operon repressor
MTIQVIDRAVKLLRIVARRGPSTLTEISREAGLPLPTTARILDSLAENGVIGRLDGRRYQLGARLLPLTTSLEPFRKSLAAVHPVLEELAELTGEDCGFAVLQGKEAVGARRARVIEPYSREIPLYCAFGKVLIAFQPASWRQRFLSSAELKRLAAGTVLDKEALAAEIVRIRQTGLHVSYAENVEGAGSLSVPVFDGLSRLHGALFITGPVDSVEADRFLKHKELLFGAARRLHLELKRAVPSRPRRRAAAA